MLVRATRAEMVSHNHTRAFERDRKIALGWFNKSSDLRAAAAALWMSQKEEVSRSIVEECGLGPGFRMDAAVPGVYLMLAGMSLELMYKSVLVAKATDVPPTHNLLRLAGSAGVQVADEETALLQILTEAVVWDGRYPVPKQVEHYEKLHELVSQHLFDRDGVFRTPNGALNWDGFDRLWRDGQAAFFRHWQSSQPAV